MIESNCHYKENNSQKINHLYIYELQKKMQDIKRLIHKNLQYQLKLRQLRNNAHQRLKQNQILEKTFRKTKRRLENIHRPIISVSLYDFKIEEKKSESLKNYQIIQNVKVKQRNFLRSIFQKVDYENQHLEPYINKNMKLQQVVKTYPNNKKNIPFKEIATYYKSTGLQVYKLWKKNNKKEVKQKFTQDEDKKIKKFYFFYEENWVQISMFMEGRAAEELYYRYHKYLNPLIKKGRWDYLQNLKLLILVQYFGIGNWYQISKKLKSRTDVQIRQRFCNVLDPKLKVNTWTQQELLQLIPKVKQYNYKWSELSKIFENKTDNQIWRKFRNIMAQKPFEQIEKLVQNRQLQNKIINYKNSKNKNNKKVSQKQESTQEKDTLRKKIKVQ